MCSLLAAGQTELYQMGSLKSTITAVPQLSMPRQRMELRLQTSRPGRIHLQRLMLLQSLWRQTAQVTPPMMGVRACPLSHYLGSLVTDSSQL